MDLKRFGKVTAMGLHPNGTYRCKCDCGAGFLATKHALTHHKWDEGCPMCQDLPLKPHNYIPLYSAPDRPLHDYSSIQIGKLALQQTLEVTDKHITVQVYCSRCKQTSPQTLRSILSRRRGMGCDTDCGCSAAQEAAQRARRAAEREKARKAATKEQTAQRALRAQARDLTGQVFGNFEVVRPATKREAAKGTGIGRMWVIQCRNCQTTYVRAAAIIKRLQTTYCGKCRPHPREVNRGRNVVVAQG